MTRNTLVTRTAKLPCSPLQMPNTTCGQVEKFGLFLRRPTSNSLAELQNQPIKPKERKVLAKILYHLHHLDHCESKIFPIFSRFPMPSHNNKEICLMLVGLASDWFGVSPFVTFFLSNPSRKWI